MSRPPKDRPADRALTAALVKAAAQGIRPRCGDWRDNNPWLSDDARLRLIAARWCGDCPLIVECGAAAKENKESFGVWGGKDRTRRPSNTTTPTREESDHDRG